MGWQQLDDALEQVLASRAGPGVVATVADRDGPVYEGCAGVRDVDTGAPMTPDTIFRIASMTKLVNAIAVMQLIEQEALSLDTPVGDVLPELDDVQVLVGWDGDVPQLRAPDRRVTVRHLMTHTSGLTYDAFHADLRRYGSVTGVPMPSTGTMACFASPLIAQPGTAWNYGMSTDWLGLVVQEAAGAPLGAVYRERIFEPLGIRDIGFDLDAEQQSRLAPANIRSADGSFYASGFEWPEVVEFPSAGHGLYATARDYLQVQRLLMAGGALGEVRRLRQESVDAMFTDQLGDLRVHPMRSTMPAFSADMDLGEGVTWGLDLMLTQVRRPGRRAEGSGGWCGTFNTFFWIDPASGLTGAIYLQTLPFAEARAWAAADSFEAAVYAAAGSGGA